MTTGRTGLDPGAFADWWRSHDARVEAPVAVTGLGRGMSNVTARAVDARGRVVVLRRAPLGAVLKSAHDTAREFRILQALAATEVPAPRALFLIEDPRVADVPVMGMEMVEGLTIDDVATARRLEEAQRARVGASVVDALARLHDLDLKGVGLADLASHEPYAPRQLRRWRRQIADGPMPAPPGLVELSERLGRAVPPQHEVTLVHADCHLANVAVDAQGRVAALFDWELCTLGEPLADVGTTLAYWPEAGDADPPGPYPQTTLPGFSTRAELAQRYETATGRDTGALAFWECFGAWRIAAIYKGVLERRVSRGELSRDQALADPLIPDMLARAARPAAEAGL
ncbi:phosphotransferase family protein [Nocardioides acrostichi]|uniref:Phosphotransferase family protein n=1 Tax=Nocardioides acrostichi TaxID=2784339 RepID=A0A930Y9W9_9ACTN|nr:phosphotransferase family protein [Nocardioides acrostichi]MBF4160808.1 phosphotransferase family protein [Nocardioides acrostichi]